MTQSFPVLNAKSLRLFAIAAALMLGATTVTLAANLAGLTVMGVAPDGTETPLTEYRWLVEDNQTYHVPVEADGTAMGGPNFDPNWQQGSAVDVRHRRVDLGNDEPSACDKVREGAHRDAEADGPILVWR